MGGHALTERVVRQIAGLGVMADQFQSLDHRTVGGVVAAKLEHVQQCDQPAAVMPGVGGPQRRLHRPPIHRTLGLELVHQLPQRLLPSRHGREHHLTHRTIRLLERRFSNREEDVLLTRHFPERVDQLVGDPAFGASADPVHSRDQQLDQGVGDFPLPLVNQRRQQRHRQRWRVTA